MFTEFYSEVKRLHPPTLRSRARHLTLDLLSYIGKNALDTTLGTPRVQFLYIHHIFRDEEESLRSLLEKLSRQHTFISHTEACDRVLHGNIDKPYISISSDDGFRNNVRAAAIMKEFGVSACFFICPGMIGINSPDEIGRFCRQRLHLPPVEFMNWDEVELLMKQGHEIGSHTLSHVRISTCPEPELSEEIGRSYELIKARCGRADHFAFPYGRFSDFSEAGRRLVFAAGHRTCSSAERGCVVKPPKGLKPEDILFRRDHVILDWPISHILYFLARNLSSSSLQSLSYPFHEADHSHQ